MGHGESRNLQASSILHRFFELGILIKGVDGGLELVGGLLLVFLSPVAINRVVFFFVQGELKEDPTDLVANLILHTMRSAIEVRLPASVFLIVHGTVKLVLVGGQPLVGDTDFAAIFRARRASARSMIVDEAPKLAHAALARRIAGCPIAEPGVAVSASSSQM